MAAKLALLVLFAVVASASAWGYNPWGWAPYRHHHHRGYYYDGAPALHPDGGVSSVSRSVQGIGKRSADAEPEADAEADAEAHHGYGYNRWGYAPWGHRGYYGYPHATSYEYRSPQGLGKRSADAEPEADAGHYGYNRWGWAPYSYAYSFPGASVYENRRGKRSADPWWGGAHSFQTVNRALPWGGVSSYSVNDNVWNARVSEHSRTPFAAYGYGFHN